MEVSGAVYRSIPSISGARNDVRFQYSPLSGIPHDARALRGRGSNLCLRFASSGFRDTGHVRYYSTTTVRCSVDKEKTKLKEKEATRKSLKKRLKMLKSLSKDLSNFSGMGFGLDPEAGLVNQVKGKMISDATELLLGQLKQLKMEEKELKKKRKEEKAKMKAARMGHKLGCDGSSSSSSESSDSECGEALDMSSLKSSSLPQPVADDLQPAIQESTLVLPVLPIDEISRIEFQPVTTQVETQILPSNAQVETVTPGSLSEVNPAGSLEREFYSRSSGNGSSVYLGVAETKIEVCMGGKCKKSGGAQLLEEFQKAVGVEGVCGCKCMGKCREGPNVRVVNSGVMTSDDGSVKTPSNNRLCKGVGLEDVSLIVCKFFGEDQKRFSLAPAS